MPFLSIEVVVGINNGKVSQTTDIAFGSWNDYDVRS